MKKSKNYPNIKVKKPKKPKKKICPLCSKKRIVKYRVFAVSPSNPHLKGAIEVCQTCNRNTRPERRLEE